MTSDIAISWIDDHYISSASVVLPSSSVDLRRTELNFLRSTDIKDAPPSLLTNDDSEDIIYGYNSDTFSRIPIGSKTLRDKVLQYKSEPNNDVKIYSPKDLEVGDVVLTLDGSEHTITEINECIHSKGGHVWDKHGTNKSFVGDYKLKDIKFIVKQYYKDEIKDIVARHVRTRLIQNMNNQWNNTSERCESEIPFSFDKLEEGDDVILTDGQKVYIMEIEKPWFGVKTIIGRPYSSTYDEWQWNQYGRGKGDYTQSIKTIVKQNKSKQISLIDEEAVNAFMNGKTTFNKWLNVTH